MAIKKIDDTILSGIADAIRSKTGGTAAMTPAEMPEQIESIQSGGGGDTLANLLNGTITEYASNDVTKIPAYAFYTNRTLQKISLPNVNPEINSASNAFYNSEATEIDIGPVRKIVESPKMFSYSKIEKIPFSETLEEIDKYSNNIFANSKLNGDVCLPLCKTPFTSQGFGFIDNITSIKFPSVDPSMSCNTNSTFNFCKKLKSIDITAILAEGKTCNLYFDSNFAFWCSTLTEFILRTNVLIPSKASGIFPQTPISSGTGYIYVPSELVDTYKAATNWAAYADQIRALEDYTVDGTIYGELDETKI